jgi:hypothetical protein
VTEHPDPTQESAAKRRVLVGTVVGILAVVAIGWGLAATTGSPREGPWRATYFDDPNFETPAETLREGDVRFEWADGPARPGGPRDHFSVRFETCLHSDGNPLVFQLVSNDASTLFLDGKPIIDNTGQHRERSRGQELTPTAGVHHLRVDYRDFEGRAMVALLASFAGERPEAIPVRMLELPADDGTCARR